MVFSSKTICRYMPQLTSPVSGSAATIMCHVDRYRPPSPSCTMGAGRSKRLASSPRRTTSLHGACSRLDHPRRDGPALGALEVDPGDLGDAGVSRQTQRDGQLAVGGQRCPQGLEPLVVLDALEVRRRSSLLAHPPDDGAHLEVPVDLLVDLDQVTARPQRLDERAVVLVVDPASRSDSPAVRRWSSCRSCLTPSPWTRPCRPEPCHLPCARRMNSPSSRRTPGPPARSVT